MDYGPFIVSNTIKHGDFPVCYVSLPGYQRVPTTHDDCLGWIAKHAGRLEY